MEERGIVVDQQRLLERVVSAVGIALIIAEGLVLFTSVRVPRSFLAALFYMMLLSLGMLIRVWVLNLTEYLGENDDEERK